MYFVYVFGPTTTSLEAMGLKLYYIIMTPHAHHWRPPRLLRLHLCPCEHSCGGQGLKVLTNQTSSQVSNIEHNFFWSDVPRSERMLWSNFDAIDRKPSWAFCEGYKDHP